MFNCTASANYTSEAVSRVGPQLTTWCRLLTVVQVSSTQNKCQVQQDCAQEVIYEQEQPTSAVDRQIG